MDKVKGLVLTQEQVEAIKEEIDVRVNELVLLIPDYNAPLKFITDFSNLQSEITAFRKLLDNHSDALDVLIASAENEDDANE